MRISTLRGLLMRTMIVRLRPAPPAELDILSAVGSGGHTYGSLQEQFRAAARPLIEVLEGTYEKTRARYSLALSAYGAGDLDILSSASAIQHGVVEYQPLLPSRAFAVTATEDVLRELQTLDVVEDVHPNYVYELPDLGPTTRSAPLDILWGEDGNLQAWHLDHVQARGPNRKRAGQSVKVAVLDTGLDCTHGEFPNGNQIPFAEWDDGGKSVNAPIRRDTHGHGTHVAGLLCGQTIGVAPAVSLHIGLIAPAGRTNFAQVNQGLDWAAQQGVHIVNLSVGKKGYAGEMEEFIRFASRANILVVAAVGNDED